MYTKASFKSAYIARKLDVKQMWPFNKTDKKKNIFTTRQNSMGPLKYDLSEIQIPKFIQHVPSHILAETLVK